MPPFHKILATSALCLAAVGLNSCRLALHTLPDYVGKQEFKLYDEEKPGNEVYSCEDVLYVKLPGYYVRPRVALFESYDLKDGSWGNALGRSYVARPHIAETTLYLPLSQELVRKWNATNSQSRLQFVRYQSGFLTEEQIKEKQGKLIAHGRVNGNLETAICEAATQRNYAHYALRPITLPLELVDTISTIPLSVAAGATGLIVGVSVTLVPLPHQRQTVQQPEPENKTSEIE
ncbi:MAG: hypothetical protein IJB33_00825 [Akkermansia sp.]|nr:hypothetical protein [Akkermansia sp.]